MSALSKNPDTINTSGHLMYVWFGGGGVGGARERGRGYCAGKNTQMEWAWAEYSRASPVTANPKAGLTQGPQLLWNLALSQFSAHCLIPKAAPKTLCSQTDLVQNYLVMPFTSTLLFSSAGFGITGLRYELVLQTLSLNLLEQDLLSQVFWNKPDSASGLTLALQTSHDWAVLQLHF